MASQSNIVSFDEVRRDASSQGRSARQRAAAERAAKAGRYIPSRDDVYAFAGSAASPTSAASPRQATPARAATQPRAARPEAQPQARGDGGASSPKRTRAQERKRSKQKQKAKRAYAKRYGKDEAAAAAAAAEAAGPRAAVYKGQMGAKQRQAQRMQEQQPSSQHAGKRPRRMPVRALASVAVVACLVLSCAFMYPTAREYYQTIRENDRLQAEYDALVQRNEAIEGQIAVLQTDSGVEQAAREDYGWVMEDEVAGTVEGLEDADADASADGDTDEDSVVQANVTSASVELPETWYSPLLDVIFGVE